MLFVATNLTVEAVADPAFLRRMGYRLHVNKPTPEDYCKIFQNYAARFDISVDPEFFPGLLGRYKEEGRDLRCSEARDLIERIRDVCKLRHEPFRIDEELMDIAWPSYFGNQ